MTEAELMMRLEKLERDNRRHKRFGFAALVLVAVVGAIYATRPVPDKITAHEFDVVDEAGKALIKLRSVKAKDSPPFGEIEVLDSVSKASIMLSQSGDIGLLEFGVPGRLCTICLRAGDSTKGEASDILLAAAPYPGITPRVGTQRIDLTVGPSGVPDVLLSDSSGYETELGGFISAASITMLGNDKKHHVIWKAP